MNIWYNKEALEDEGWDEEELLSLDKYWDILILRVTFKNIKNKYLLIRPTSDDVWRYYTGYPVSIGPDKWTFPIPEGLAKRITKGVFV